jgi:serralysin
MAFSAAEQYLLELINRARLDPAAEASRQGVALTAGGADVSGAVKQVLAPNDALQTAATNHTAWMFANDVFAHQGAGGLTSLGRAENLGYYGRVGENLSWLGQQGSTESWVSSHFDNLWSSPAHRPNTMRDEFKEIGLDVANGMGGLRGASGTAASIVTEVFGVRGPGAFVTGVAYTDRNDNGFYNIGEGRSGVSIKVGSTTDRTEGAGGYAVLTSPSGTTAVTVTAGSTVGSLTVDTRGGNVKLDVVDGNMLYLSRHFDLGNSAFDVKMIGAGDINGAGSTGADRIIGNKGDNLIEGDDGNDNLRGGSGRDTIQGNQDDDLIYGEANNDKLYGGAGDDTVYGGSGNDFVSGRTGDDILYGLSGADKFEMVDGGGRDMVKDFSAADGDRIVLDDALWTGRMTATQVVEEFGRMTSAGNACLDFGANGVIVLEGVSSLRGLSAAIDII